MALADGRAAAISAMVASWNNANQPADTAAGMVDAIIALIKTAGVGTIEAPPGTSGGPCSGSLS